MRHQELLEPSAIALLVLAYLQAVYGFVTAWRSDNFFWLTVSLSATGMVWTIIVAGTVVITALFASSRRTRAISLAAAVWLWLAVSTSVLSFVVQITSERPVRVLPLVIVGFLIDVAFKGVLAVLVTRIWRDSVPEDLHVVEVEPAEIPAKQTADLPVWAPENAVGQQWTRAGDAATGAPAVQPNTGRGRWQADNTGTQANWAAIETRPLTTPGEP